MKNKTILTLNTDWQNSTVEFTNVDVSLEQYFSAFKGLLVQNSWSEQTINEYIVELAEELKGSYE